MRTTRALTTVAGVASAGVVLWFVVSGATGVGNGRSVVGPSPAAVPAAPARPRSPEELLRAIVSGGLDPSGDRELIESALDTMTPADRAAWIAELARIVGALDPRENGNLQRSVGFLALSRGELDAGWTALGGLLACKDCGHSADDALRLLDQYTPGDDLRRADLTTALCARADQVLGADTPDPGALPLVWSAFSRLKGSGRLEDAIGLQQRYIDRFGGVISAEALTTARQNLAHDLLDAGRRDEARRNFVAVAASLRSADGSMSGERADYLVHAARLAERPQAEAEIEAALADRHERQSQAATLLYLELQRLRREAGDAAGSVRTAERYWAARATMDDAGRSSLTPEYAALICFYAAEAAEAAGRALEARTWYARAVEVGGNSSTANAVRRMLADGR